MVTYEELLPIEKKWVDEWVQGICDFASRGPPGEPPEETRREFENCRVTFMEKKDELAVRARRWRNRLLEALGLPQAPE